MENKQRTERELLWARWVALCMTLSYFSIPNRLQRLRANKAPETTTPPIKENLPQTPPGDTRKPGKRAHPPPLFLPDISLMGLRFLL